MNLKDKSTEDLLDMMALVAARGRDDMNRTVNLQDVRISNIVHFNRHIRSTDDALLNQALKTLMEIGAVLNERRSK